MATLHILRRAGGRWHYFFSFLGGAGASLQQVTEVLIQHKHDRVVRDYPRQICVEPGVKCYRALALQDPPTHCE